MVVVVKKDWIIVEVGAERQGLWVWLQRGKLEDG